VKTCVFIVGMWITFEPMSRSGTRMPFGKTSLSTLIFASGSYLTHLVGFSFRYWISIFWRSSTGCRLLFTAPTRQSTTTVRFCAA
jgi:hypothetical protein